MRKVFILVVFLVSVGEISGQWLSGYSYRKLITINDTAVSGSVDLQDYPFLYSTTDTVLRSVFHGGLVFSDNGWDIRFTGDDGITLLDHEVEMFTASTGELIAWIRIPVLSYSEDTELYMYFGNQGIQSDPSTSNAWSTDFRGVWHLNGNADDASQYNNNGVNNGALSVAGKIGNAYNFDGIDDNINIPNHASLNITGDITLQAWARVTSENDTAWILTGKNHDYWLWYDWNRMIFFAGEVHLGYTVDFNPNQWYHFAGTHDGSVMRLYIDGTEVASQANSNPTSNDSNEPLTMGFYPVNPDPWNLTGDIDELRLLSVPLTGDWIKTSYDNQNNPAIFSSSGVAAIVNDLPCNAIVLPVDTVCNPSIFSNQYATDSGIPLTECEAYSGGDTWFKVEVPPSGNILAEIESGAISEIPDTNDWIDRPGLAVYSGSCSSLIHDTCWIDPDSGSPYMMPSIFLRDYTPGDTLFLRVWEHNNDVIGKFRICIRNPAAEIFSVSGSGSYCTGGSGLSINLNGSETGVNYQLLKNGLAQEDSVPGTGSELTWLNQTEGVYEVVATNVSSGLSEKMNGKAIVIEAPLPVVSFGYGYDKTITIGSGNVAGTVDMINFPMLVSIPNDNDLRTTGNGGNVQNSNGYDIVFTDENYNPVPFERIAFDPVTGAYSAWVNVPSVAYNSDTDIHMLYGNSGNISDHSSIETWSSDYVQVMHLEGDFTDATLTGNYGVNNGTSDSEGKLGSGRNFDGIDNNIIVFDDPTLDGTNDEATFSLWIKFTDASDGDHQFILSTENRFSGEGYEWASQGTGDHFFYPNGNHNDNYNIGSNPFTDGVWHYLAVTLNYSTLEVDIYVDSLQMAFTAENVPSFWSGLAVLDNWLWGGNPDRNTRYFDGNMDEIRTQTVARSEDWLVTEYRNQNNPSGFYTLSPESPYAQLTDACLDDAPIILNQPQPAGGSFSGTGIAGGTFYPGLAGAGDHIITYNYTDGNGCNSSGTEIQTVYGLPTPTITGNDSLCSGALPETYSTPDVVGNSYSWVITGDGASITNGQGTNEITVDWGPSSGTLIVIETIDATGCDSTTADFNVNIGDVTNPSVTCPGDQTAYIDNNCEFSLPDYTGLVSYSDNCDPDPAISQSPTPGTLLSRDTTVTISVEDSSGNSAQCQFNVAIQDTIPPAVTCPGDQTEYLNNNCEFSLPDYTGLASYSDNCDPGPVITQSPAPGSLLSGDTAIYQVSISVEDNGGNMVQCYFNVILQDTVSPALTCTGDVTENLDDSCEFSLADYTSLISPGDNCDSSPTLTQSPAPGTILRGSGTSQEIVFLARDATGNESECRFNVILQDNMLPGVTSLRDTVVIVEEGVYNAPLTIPLPVFLDNCGVQSVINDFNGGTDASGDYPFGTTTVVYTVSDNNGNIAHFNQQVTVRFENEVEYGLIIPEGFSPNEDGLNDRFEILGIENYPDIELRVFNVHGTEVYRKSNYDNSWDGTSTSNLNHGSKLPTGTYYYAIYLNSQGTVLKGFVFLRRE